MPDDPKLDDAQLAEASTSEDTGETEAPRDNDPLDGREDLQNALRSLYEKCCGEDRYPRLVEVKDVKRAEFYWGGRQYIWWSSQDKKWNLPSQASTLNYGDLNIEDMPRFEFVTNIYQATGLTVIGAVAGAPPRVRFFPDDADDENDLETAEGRTKLARLIQRWNPQQKLLQEETYHAWTGGFIAWWTRFIPDEQASESEAMHQGSLDAESTISCPNCGWSAPANEAIPPVPCPQCGAALTEENLSEEAPIPVPEGGEEPNEQAEGRQLISVYGALNCKRPQHTSHQSQFHYFAIEDEEHYSGIRAEFPDKADQIKPGMAFGADDQFERNARLSVLENTQLLTQTGAAQANLCTRARVWFRRRAFWALDNKDLRDELCDLFPDGCRVEFCGTTYLCSEAENMDDCIVTAHAMPGRGQHRNGIGTAELSVQDRYNTGTNIQTETYEYGIPITYRASDTFSGEANEEQRAAPGLECEVKLRSGEDIRQRIMQVRADSISPDMYKYLTDLLGPVTQYLSGTYPALTGAAQNQPETLGQQAMQRDQAMGRMGVFYVNLKQAHADILTLACRDFEAHAGSEVKIPVLGASGDFETESVDITALEGEATAYPEGDENFPELWNQQRATMMQIMDTPYGQALSKEPGNQELFAKLTGIPDLKIPGLDSWRKQLKEIAQLTKMPEGAGGLEGSVVGIAPMVEVDSDDFHDIESACCRWWMNSDAGQKLKRINPLGWQAVKEHKAQHDAAIPPPEPQFKPTSETFTTNFKDLPPEAQAQALARFGIHLSPQDFMAAIAVEQAKKKPAIPPQAGLPQGAQANA